jgi:preprotein translocase subunit SecG
LATYVTIVEIIISLALILLVLVQTRGEGFSATFSADSSIFRTRRGVEKTLFQLTIAVAVIWIATSIVSVVVNR